MGDREGVPSQRPAIRRQLDSNSATIGDTNGTVDLEKQEGSELTGDGQPRAPDAALPADMAAAAAAAAGGESLDKDGSGVAGGSEQQEGEFAVLEAPSTELQPASYWEIFKYFGILGWTAFGGPAAHVAMFQKVRWQQRQRLIGAECFIVKYSTAANPEPLTTAPASSCSCLSRSCGG